MINYKHKILFIVLYYGELPGTFALWLHSCNKNPSINWLVMTDRPVPYELPDNVMVSYTAFDELRDRFQEQFDFEIKLNRPYKLCDYRPVYGSVFREEILGYDFWGWCDLDLIWGNLRAFLTETVLDRYLKVFTRGHCTLMRNMSAMNAAWKTLDHHGCMDYRAVFSSDKSFAFDENSVGLGGGFSEIVRRNSIEQYDEVCYANIRAGRYGLDKSLVSDKRKYSVYTYHDGRLLQWYVGSRGAVETEEQMYIHLCRRPMKIMCRDIDRYMIIPYSYIVDIDEIDIGTRELRKLYWKNRYRSTMDNTTIGGRDSYADCR